jgi:hypothetical protein
VKLSVDADAAPACWPFEFDCEYRRSSSTASIDAGMRMILKALGNRSANSRMSFMRSKYASQMVTDSPIGPAALDPRTIVLSTLFDAIRSTTERSDKFLDCLNTFDLTKSRLASSPVSPNTIAIQTGGDGGGCDDDAEGDASSYWTEERSPQRRLRRVSRLLEDDAMTRSE